MTVLDEDPEPLDLPSLNKLQGEVKGWSKEESRFNVGSVRVWTYGQDRFHIYIREREAGSGGAYGMTFLEFTSKEDAIRVGKMLANALGVGFSVDWNPDP
jgi:hypothetical protein